MLVDDTHARDAGRAVWGYPKVTALSGGQQQQQGQQLSSCFAVVCCHYCSRLLAARALGVAQ
jgi:hypothetical protein